MPKDVQNSSTHSFPAYGLNISIEQACAVVNAAIDAAQSTGDRMVVAVVDTSGCLVAFQRMDNAHIASADVAQDKARSAATFRRSTKVFEQAITAGGEGLRVLTMRGACAVEGGIPLIVDGKIVGAVGVSGGTPARDGEVALVASHALNRSH
jgi:uncharacterized protein GlcG (DUF336 family)